MSKLAALAAKRRQKENANQAASETSAKPESTDEYAASLSKLSLGDPSKRRNLKDKDNDVVMGNGLATQEEVANPESAEPAVESNPEEEPVVTRIHPSAFANTFLNTTRTTSLGSHIDPDLLKHTTPAFDFKDPSPDDIIERAQTGRTR